jgi:hypothetical protein
MFHLNLLLYSDFRNEFTWSPLPTFTLLFSFIDFVMFHCTFWNINQVGIPTLSTTCSYCDYSIQLWKSSQRILSSLFQDLQGSDPPRTNSDQNSANLCNLDLLPDHSVMGSHWDQFFSVNGCITCCKFEKKVEILYYFLCDIWKCMFPCDYSTVCNSFTGAIKVHAVW